MKLRQSNYRLLGWILVFCSPFISTLLFFALETFCKPTWLELGFIVYNYPLLLSLTLVFFSKTKNENFAIAQLKKKSIRVGVVSFLILGGLFPILFIVFRAYSDKLFNNLLFAVNTLLIIILVDFEIRLRKDLGKLIT